MSFVFKEQQPRFFNAVNVNVYLDRAGIDLLGLVKFVKLAVLLEVFDGYRRKIHKADRLCAAELLSYCDVFVICLLQQLILEFHAVDNGQKGRVAAVIGPVGVDHAYLRYRRIAVLGFEIVLAECDVVAVHCEAVLPDEILKPLSVEIYKAVKSPDAGRKVVFDLERLRFFEARLARFNGVNNIFFYLFNVCVSELACQNIYFCRAYQRPLALRDYLYALGGGVCALIELPGQILDCEALAVDVDIVRDYVELRLGEYGALCVAKQLLRDVLCVVAVYHAHVFESLYAEQNYRIGEQSLRLVGELGLLFNVNSVDHLFFPLCHERPCADVVPEKCVGKMYLRNFFVC